MKKIVPAVPGGFRGQAAMEYLMTYGWAILVIVIVLSVLLFYLPQFLKAPESCIFAQPGFSCSEKRPAIYLDGDGNVNLAIEVFNSNGKPVEVHKILCTTAGVGNADESLATPTTDDTDTIAAGGSETFDIGCKNKDGNSVQLSAGSNFQGNFIIWYNFQDDVQPDSGKVERQANAVVSGQVLKQS